MFFHSVMQGNKHGCRYERKDHIRICLLSIGRSALQLQRWSRSIQRSDPGKRLGKPEKISLASL